MGRTDGRAALVDLAVGAIHRSDLASGNDVVTTYGQSVSALALTDAGGVAVAMARGFARIDEERLDDVQDFLLPGSRMNDAKCDPYGCFVGGSLTLGFDPGEGALWRWSPGEPPEPVLRGLTRPNGFAWARRVAASSATPGRGRSRRTAKARPG